MLTKNINEKIKYYNPDEEYISKPKISRKRNDKYDWICRNLKQFKNCFVNTTTFDKIDLNKIKQILKVDEVHFYPSETTDANNYSTGASGYILYI